MISAENPASVADNEKISHATRVDVARSSTYSAASFRRGLHRAVWIAVGLLCVTTAFLLGYWRIDERLSPKRWGEVVPGKVYRSGQISRYRVEDVLRENKIATVIDLSGFERHNADQLVEVAVSEYLAIDHHRFPLAGDGTGDVDKIAHAVALIAERERLGKRVLVHCAAGTYRTGGVIAVYRLLVRRDSPAKVIDDMAAYGYDPAENPKLITFLNANMKLFAEELAARNILDRVPDEIPQFRL